MNISPSPPDNPNSESRKRCGLIPNLWRWSCVWQACGAGRHIFLKCILNFHATLCCCCCCCCCCEDLPLGGPLAVVCVGTVMTVCRGRGRTCPRPAPPTTAPQGGGGELLPQPAAGRPSTLRTLSLCLQDRLKVSMDPWGRGGNWNIHV